MVTLLVPLTRGYDLVRYNGQLTTWNPGTVTMRVQLGSGTALSDGSTYNSSVQTALQTWNSLLGTLQFASQVASPATPVDGNHLNEIGFDSTVYGTAFDANVLAVTVFYYSTTPRPDGSYLRTQSDIVFNSAYTWDSYRGPLRSAEEIQRVALHELGHVLGLDHPDEASPPQYITALMNSHESDLDTLAADDIAGAQSLYGVANVAPSITSQPANATVYAGQNAQFPVAGSGYPAPSFQWQRLPSGSGTWANLSNGGSYSGTATAILTVSNTNLAMNGDQFRCVATNGSGYSTSSPATLTVQAVVAPGITALPVSVNLNFGTGFSLVPFVTGTQPISFQWKKDGVDINGATDATFFKSSVVPTDGGVYTLTATNSAGSIISSTVTLAVYGSGGPTFIKQPSSLTVTSGTSVSFDIFVSGFWPAITYQWYFNGDLLTGATSTTLAISNVQANNAGNYTVVVKGPGGSVVSNTAVLTISPALGVVAVSAGKDFSAMVKSDGTIWTTGNNYSGQLGDGTTTNRKFFAEVATGVAVAATGDAHCLFIKDDGTLWATGNNASGQLGDGTNSSRSSPVQIATGVVSVAAGPAHSLFIKSDGTVWAMGGNWLGQLGDGTNVSRSSPVKVASGVFAIAAGSDYSLFIKFDRTLWAMGGNYTSGTGPGIDYGGSPVQIATDVVSAAAGSTHILFVKTDGSLCALGNNADGQLGDGTTTTRSSPRVVATGVDEVMAGYQSSSFIKLDHSWWGMGDNSSYQFSDGNSTDHLSPILIATEVTAATVGETHRLGIKSDGSLWGIGRSSEGQFGTNTSYLDLGPVQITNGPLMVPSAPVGLIASDGVLDQGIRISWNPTLAASYYEVWRNSVNDPAAATQISARNPISLIYDATAVPGQIYYYWVKAGNASGISGFSASDSGVLGGAPTFTSQPISQIASTGAAITFSSAATSLTSQTFQWQKGGVNISGATGSSYMIANVAAGDVASYTVVATNSFGSSTSDVATLALGTIPAGFDVQGYLTRYPDVAAVYGSNPYAAWTYYRDYGIYQGEVFDELFRVEEYFALYPNLFTLFGSDLSAALDHWLSTGRIEGKLGRIPLEFSATGYFARNADVAAAVNNNPILAWGHYWAYGIYEGRAYDEDLRVFEYLAVNADLTAAFVEDWRQAALHWMRYGRTEGRLGRLPLTFSVATYLTRNPDVAAVWGTDPTTVFLHFWLYGIDEARTYDDLFRVDEYLALNPDLAAVFGTDRRGAFKHWVRYGQAEGRPGRNP